MRSLGVVVLQPGRDRSAELEPTALAVAGDRLYVADWGYYRILRFRLNL